MMKLTRSIQCLFVSGLFFAGCSTPTQVSKESIPAATFNFIPLSTKQSAFTENRQPIHGLIQEAITRNLSAKGLTRVAERGDVTVAYLVVVGDNATTTSINDYFGYSSDTTALLEKAHKAYTDKERRDYFEAGTLLIDIIDPKTQKVLERNYAVRPLLRNAPQDVRQANLQEAVDAILKDVRIKR